MPLPHHCHNTVWTSPALLLQFDISSDPRTPKFLKSNTALLPGKGNAVGGAVADHVFGLADGTYLTTQVCRK